MPASEKPLDTVAGPDTVDWCGEATVLLVDDEESIVELATENELRVLLRFRPGQLIVEEDALVATNSSADIPEALKEEIRSCGVKCGWRRCQYYLLSQSLEVAKKSSTSD